MAYVKDPSDSNGHARNRVILANLLELIDFLKF